MPKIEIQIGAYKAELEKKLAEAVVDVKDLQNKIKGQLKIGADTKELTAQLNIAKDNVNALKSSLNNASSATTNFSKSTANGGATLMQFSRIAQDAPFGLMGIGNNLTATTESFVSLSKSAGGTGNAFKAVGASLMGPGGVLLAISLVTSAFTYMSQNGITLSDVFAKLGGNVNHFKENVNALNKELQDNGQEYAKQKIQAEVLYKTATDLNKSYSERKKAVDELQSQFPTYFKNLSDEEIMAGKNVDKYKELQKAILDTARARAAETLLQKKELERLDQETKLRERLSSAASAYNKGAKIDDSKNQTTYGGGGGSVVGSGGGVSGITRKQAMDAAKKDYENAKKELQQLNKDFEKENQFLINTIQKGNIVKGSLEKQKAPKKQKAKAEKREVPIISTLVPNDPNKDLAVYKKQITAIEEAVGKSDIKDVKIPLNIDVKPDETKKHLDEAIGYLSEFDIAANDIIQNGIASTFSQIGDAMGQAFATGGNLLQSAGQALVQGLGGILSAMGDQLIKMGTAAVLAGTVVKLFGTIAGVGAGLAAIAGGVLLKGIGTALSTKGNKNVSSGASGGSGSGFSTNTGGNSYSSSGSTVSGVTNNSGGTVVFEIAGQKLIGVLNNTLGANQRLGGSLSLGN